MWCICGMFLLHQSSLPVSLCCHGVFWKKNTFMDFPYLLWEILSARVCGCQFCPTMLNGCTYIVHIGLSACPLVQGFDEGNNVLLSRSCVSRYQHDPKWLTSEVTDLFCLLFPLFVLFIFNAVHIHVNVSLSHHVSLKWDAAKLK